ncbi:MAG: ankyrin repeat domain-containing protein [Planctomycetes bacterium]|nr:ankyrin repeat domain-containing protein [Planctomycetota bacterium]
MFDRIADGRTDLVLPHLSTGGDAAATDAGGVSLLAWCAYHGDVTAVRALLDAGAALTSLGDDLGLRGAAFHGHWQLCQYLLENGANARAVDPVTGETALHAALCKANRPIYDHVVAVLLAHGADPGAKAAPDAPTGAFMRDCRTRGETPLHRAAAFGSATAVKQLLDAGANRAARDARGETPLAWASWHLRPPEILRLLCYGEHRVHPGNASTYDHGAGWGQFDAHAMGRPHLG